MAKTNNQTSNAAAAAAPTAPTAAPATGTGVGTQAAPLAGPAVETKPEVAVVVTASPEVVSAIVSHLTLATSAEGAWLTIADKAGEEGKRLFGDDAKRIRRMVELSLIEAHGLAGATEEAKKEFLATEKFQVSNIMAIVFPNASDELTKARKINSELPEGHKTRDRIGIVNLLKIARGSLTVAEVLAAKELGKPRGNKPSAATVATQTAVANQATAPTGAATAPATAPQAPAGPTPAEVARMAPKDQFEAGIRLTVRHYRDTLSVPVEVLAEMLRRIIAEELTR